MYSHGFCYNLPEYSTLINLCMINGGVKIYNFRHDTTEESVIFAFMHAREDGSGEEIYAVYSQGDTATYQHLFFYHEVIYASELPSDVNHFESASMRIYNTLPERDCGDWYEHSVDFDTFEYNCEADE